MFLKGDVSELVRGTGYLGFVSPFLTKGDVSECERGSCFLGLVLTYRTAAAYKLKGFENMKQAAAAYTAIRREDSVSETFDAPSTGPETAPHIEVLVFSGSRVENDLNGSMLEFAGFA